MNIRLHVGVPDDATVCGRICYDAFGAISHAHGFPNDYPSVEAATGLVSSLLGHPGFYTVVAEADGSVVGSNFMDERAAIAGVGPVSVEPGMQDRGIGRLLMQDVLQRAAGRHVSRDPPPSDHLPQSVIVAVCQARLSGARTGGVCARFAAEGGYTWVRGAGRDCGRYRDVRFALRTGSWA